MNKPILKYLLVALTVLIVGWGAKAISIPESVSATSIASVTKITDHSNVSDADYAALHSEVGLQAMVDHDAFAMAMKGYGNIKDHKKDILVLIDFTKPSTQERLHIVDVKNRRLLLSSYVSHGRNSGGNYATSFSNDAGSYKSSLGFYVTENTYTGRNGYSLVLDGLEKGFNDRAKERAIVIHGAPYCNPANIASVGRLGRSLGCPALPPATSKEIIDIIKDGAVIFIYADDKNYAAQSDLIN